MGGMGMGAPREGGRPSEVSELRLILNRNSIAPFPAPVCAPHLLRAPSEYTCVGFVDILRAAGQRVGERRCRRTGILDRISGGNGNRSGRLSYFTILCQLPRAPAKYTIVGFVYICHLAFEGGHVTKVDA